MHGRTQVILTALAAALALVLIAFVLRLRGRIDDQREARAPQRVESASRGADPEALGQPGSAEPDEARSAAGEREALFVRGRVFDARSGEPLVASIAIHLEDGGEARTESSADGMFHLECAPAARARLTVPKSREHLGLEQELAVAPGMRELALALAPCRTLPVLLLDPGGAPLRAVVEPQHAGLAVRAWPSVLVSSAAPAESVRASESAMPEFLRVGRWIPEPSDQPPGCEGHVQLSCAPPAFASLVLGDRVLETRALGGTEALLEFRVDPARLAEARCSLALRVLDAATGQPPVNHLGLTLAPVGDRRELALLEIDDAGRVEFEDLPAGALDLRLEFGGYEHETRTLELSAGQRNDLGDIQIRHGACISGSVSTRSGEPVPARLWCSSEEGREHPVGRWSNLAEGSSTFAVCSLPRAKLLLGIDDGTHALNPIWVDTSRGSLQNLQLEARKGDLLRLAGPYASSGAARLRLCDGHGLCLWTGDNVEAEEHELCLLPGPYSVEVLHADGRRTHREFELGSVPRVTLLLE